MARQLVVLALVFAGVICHAYAGANSTFAPMPSDGADASSPGADDTVGEIDGEAGGLPSDAVAGPVGGPIANRVVVGAPPETVDLSGAAASVTVYSASVIVAIGGVVAGYLF